MTPEERSHCYDIKYWSYGYSRVDILKEVTDNVVGYISKYMTKDIDNRLFGRNKYLSSKSGLNKPETVFLDSGNDQDFLTLVSCISNTEKKYENTYLTPLGDMIQFIEYKKVG